MRRADQTGARGLALALSAGLVCFAAAPAGAGPILALRPGPIDRPLHLLSADFDRDGLDDLILANFQAGTLTLLINQRNGAFSPHPGSPFALSPAAFSSPTTGPLHLVTADLNPEDVDGDRVPNALDNCPNVHNPVNALLGGQADGTCVGGPNDGGDCNDDTLCADTDTTSTTGDGICSGLNGIGRACEVLDETGDRLDTDGDGKFDYDNTFDPAEPDFAKKIAAALDNCPNFPNPPDMMGVQADSDGDRIGDECAVSPDLVVVENGFGGFGQQALGLIRVRVNDGSGGLLSRPFFEAGLGPAEGVLEDFNGDARPDLVVSNSGTGNLQLLPGLALCVGGSSSGQPCTQDDDCAGGVCGQDGRFETPQVLRAGICVGGPAAGAACTDDADCEDTSMAMPPDDGTCTAGPQGMAAADFDGDDKADLAVANRTAGAVLIYLNSGAGLPETFTSALATQPDPSALLAADLDGDGCADLVSLHQDRAVCTAGMNSGMTCAAAAECPGGSCGPEGAGNGLIQIFRHSSCGGASLLDVRATLPLAAGQLPRGGILSYLDGDGDLDLALADFGGGQTLVFRGDGAGSFASPPGTYANQVGSPSSPVAVAALGVRGGPPPDLAVLNFSNRIDLFRNDGSGTFAFSGPLSPWMRRACSGGTSDGRVCAVPADCPGGTCAPLPGASGLELMAADTLVAFDLVLLRRSPPAVDILSGIGNGYFRATGPKALTGPQSATGMLAASLRQDNFQDLLVLDGTGDTVTVLTSELTGEFVERDTLTVAARPGHAAVGTLVADRLDYDRDGVRNEEDNCPTRYNPVETETVTLSETGADTGVFTGSLDTAEKAIPEPATGLMAVTVGDVIISAYDDALNSAGGPATVTARTTVVKQVLTISKSGSPDPVTPGSDLTYTLAYSNTGTGVIHGVVITDTMPADTTFISATGGGSESGGLVTWMVPDLVAGASGSVEMVVRVSDSAAAGTPITNDAYGIDSDETPFTPGSAVVIVVSSPPAGPAVGPAGATGTLAVTQTITPGDAISLVLTDPDLDADPSAAETITLTTVNSGTGESEGPTYTETGPGTGVFMATLSTAFGLSAGANGDGTFNVKAGDALVTTYEDAETAGGTADTVTATTMVLGGIAGTIGVTSMILPGQAIAITVTDADLNTDPALPETVVVRVTNPQADGVCSGGPNDGGDCNQDADCAISDVSLPGGTCEGLDGVGRDCETLDETGGRIDSDGDDKFDYDDQADPLAPDPIAAALDNCPWVSNPGQDDADGDRVGDACDDGVCTIMGGSIQVCEGGANDRRPCGGGLRRCDGGTNDGSVCTADVECPDGICTECPGGGACVVSLGLCAGGADAGQVCAVASDCPDGSCAAARGLCFGGGDDGKICTGSADCAGGICTESLLVCLGGPRQGSSCVEDADCGAGVHDLVVTSSEADRVDLLIGDGSGAFRPASGSPIGFEKPSAALVGEFSLVCSGPGGIDCRDKATSDILVAGRGALAADPSDDKLQVLVGNGQENGFSSADSPEVSAPRGAGALLPAADQPVCADPSTVFPPSDPQVRFDNDNRSSVIAVFEPGRTTIDIYLVGGQHTCIGGTNAGTKCTGPTDTTSCSGGGSCRLISTLVLPPGHPDPLPVANPLVDAAFVDLNRDDVLDLVAVSSGGYPSSPNVTIYFGIADGLYFTDPSFNLARVPDGAAAITTGNVNLVSDFTYPEVVILNEEDDAPIVLTNVLTERADIDGSGRVDGFDLAILARAFGARRGENFVILGPGDPEVMLDPALDATLKQTLEPPASAYRKVLLESQKLCDLGLNEGTPCARDEDCPADPMDPPLPAPACRPTQRVGQDLPDFAGICDGALDRLEGLYGLPADVNLDGQIDGEDLAFIASLFGRTVPP